MKSIKQVLGVVIKDIGWCCNDLKFCYREVVEDLDGVVLI